MQSKLSIVPRESDEPPLAYPGAPLESERAQQPPLPEVPLKAHGEKPVPRAAPSEPYKDM